MIKSVEYKSYENGMYSYPKANQQSVTKWDNFKIGLAANAKVGSVVDIVSGVSGSSSAYDMFRYKSLVQSPQKAIVSFPFISMSIGLQKGNMILENYSKTIPCLNCTRYANKELFPPFKK